MSSTPGNEHGRDSSSIPVDSLELIRNRLHQVHQSLRKLAEQINYSNRVPKARLPSYSSMHGQFQVLITQLQSIASQLDANRDVLGLTNAYPLPNFPTTQHEGLVTTLLRKKPLPEVDEWIDSATKEIADIQQHIDADNSFAEWCHSKVEELIQEFNFDGFQTRETDTVEQYTENTGGPVPYKNDKTPLSSDAVMKFMTCGKL